MSSLTKRPADSYSPLYFLASLGAGGLSVTFFMFFFFWVPHPNQPVPIFEDIWAAFTTGALPLQAAILIAWAGIAVMAFLNVKYLLWNFSALSAFKKTDAYTALRNSNGETTLLAGPLATAMTINAMFIVGMAFVPKLWTVVEYLFPMALVAFGIVGIWALRLMGISSGAFWHRAASSTSPPTIALPSFCPPSRCRWSVSASPPPRPCRPPRQPSPSPW